VAIALQFVAPGYLGALVEDSDGRWMILGSILGLMLGYYVMGRITDIEV
jgi:Flp pilus assembly protein TadB